jgi:ribonucleoside-diphosphate reductase alpha chain
MNKKDIVVVKRDGTKVPYDVSKIKKSIAFATEGTGVSPLQLEATLDQVVKSGIKTSDIQDNIIQHALQLSSKQEPRWINVAGRALAMQQWGNFKLRDKSFRELVQYNIKKGEYTKDLSIYSPDQLDGLGLKIKMERDLEHSHASLVSTQKKYLGKFELNQHMHMVSSMRFGQMSPEATRLNYVTSLYDDLSQRKISLATPFMSNLRKGGNVSSCFTLAIEDDLDSIYDNIKRVAQISKNGGGVGIFLGYIRARGSEVAGNPNAAGSVLQWIKVINDTLVAVNQSFTGETLIESSLGSVPISDVVVGDYVKTHDSSFKKVTGIRSRENDTAIHSIETTLGVVKGTSGHPVLVVDKVFNAKEKLLSGEIKPYWVDVGDLSQNHLIIKAK